MARRRQGLSRPRDWRDEKTVLRSFRGDADFVALCPPPLWGRVGWGVASQPRDTDAPWHKPDFPTPHLNPPPQGGRRSNRRSSPAVGISRTQQKPKVHAHSKPQFKPNFAPRHRATPCLSPRSALREEPAHRCNCCTSPAQLIRYETHMRYRRHIRPRLRRVEALLDLQTVNAQTNLEKKIKSNQDRMIRSVFGTKRRRRFHEI